MTGLGLFFQNLIVLYCTAAVGYAAKKYKIINEHADNMLTQVILYITLPALILSSMDLPLSKSLSIDFGMLFLLSVYSMLAGCILAFILGKKAKLEQDRNGVYQGLIIFGNQGFLGFAVCSSLFPKEGVMYTAVYNIVFTIFLWTYGIYLMAKGQETFSIKKLILNPGMIFTLLGLIVYILPFNLPQTISMFLQGLGSPTTPLSMLLIGSLIANIKGEHLLKILKDIYIWIASLTKLIVLPLLLFPFALTNTKFSLLTVAVLLTAMPSGPTTSIFAKKYGGDSYFGSVGVCVTAIFSILTLPLIYILLNAL